MLTITFFNDEMEIVEICKAYWEIGSNGDFLFNTSTIGKKYGLSANKVNLIAKEYSSASSDSLFCSSCFTPYQYKNRTEYCSATEITAWTCKDCLAEKKTIEDEKKKIILSHEFMQQIENCPLSVERLDVRLSVLLLSLIRYAANEDLTFINEYFLNRTERFSPDTEDDEGFLEELYKAECISVAPFSNSDTIITLKENNSFSFYPRSVKWLLPLPEKQSFKEFVILLENKLASIDYLEANYDEIIELCKDISLRECLAYLKYKMEEHKLPFTPGDKTRLVLAKALDEYSVAQVYGFIWTAVSNTAAYYMRTQGISKKQAANAVVGNIEKSFERAYSQNWDVKAYRRDHNLPQSIVSRVLFNMLLHTDDGGFLTPLKSMLLFECQ